MANRKSESGNFQSSIRGFHARRSWSAIGPASAALVVILLAACLSGGDEKAGEKADEAKARSAARLKELTQHVKSVTVSVRDKDRERKVDPLDEPLLRYS